MKPSDLPLPSTAKNLAAALSVLGIDPDETEVYWEDAEPGITVHVAAPALLLVYRETDASERMLSYRRLSLQSLTPWRDVECRIESTSWDGRLKGSRTDLYLPAFAKGKIGGVADNPNDEWIIEFIQACLRHTISSRGRVGVEMQED